MTEVEILRAALERIASTNDAQFEQDLRAIARQAIADADAVEPEIDEKTKLIKQVMKHEANTQLIAAAPDLYAACSKALSAIDSTLDRPMSYKMAMDTLEIISAALAKARGEL